MTQLINQEDLELLFPDEKKRIIFFKLINNLLDHIEGMKQIRVEDLKDAIVNPDYAIWSPGTE